MRLVPIQDPDDILKRYTAYVKKLTPKGIETKIKVWSKGPALRGVDEQPYIKAATEAMHDIFKKDTVSSARRVDSNRDRFPGRAEDSQRDDGLRAADDNRTHRMRSSTSRIFIGGLSRFVCFLRMLAK